MSFDQKKFESELPEVFREVQKILKSFSFTPIAVGGIPRDFLLTGLVGKDWDVEVTHPTLSFSKDLWKDLGNALSQIGRMSFLTYDVIRLGSEGYQFEFSPPRKEVFQQDWEKNGHRNFTVEFDFSLPFEQAVKRRDFTINSLGIKFLSSKEMELLDPLNGVLHLREKMLHPCGEDFHKDPVRFFRALRFSQKLGFFYSEGLKKTLETMPVSTVSPAYLWMEMQKSGKPLEFYEEVLKWRIFHPGLVLPVGEEIFQKNEELKKILVDPALQEIWIIALEWIGIASESWQQYFSLGAESSRRLARWARTSREFIDLKPEIFHGEFEEVRNLPQFELLFDWYFTTKQLLQKNPNLPLINMIQEYLPDWIHLYRFEVVKDVKHIEPPYRAKYQVWNLCQRL